MVELDSKRVNQIVSEETPKTEELRTILRAVYVRYMHLYEQYFDNIDALNDKKINELKKYHDETVDLKKYYYIDIPLDICVALDKIDEEYTNELLGDDWHHYLFDKYEDFKCTFENMEKTEDYLKAEFKEQTMTAFYETMGYIFRDDLGTGSKVVKEVEESVSKFFIWK